MSMGVELEFKDGVRTLGLEARRRPTSPRPMLVRGASLPLGATRLGQTWPESDEQVR
jgi:hypothetical protein